MNKEGIMDAPRKLGAGAGVRDGFLEEVILQL